MPSAPTHGYLLDLDGVVYRGADTIAGSAAAIARLRNAGARVVFVTNNSTKTRAQFADKLSAMGIPATPDQIVNSAAATAISLETEFGALTIYAIGEAGLVEELRAQGHTVLTEPEAVEETVPDAVVIGMDRAFTYAKLAAGLTAVRAGARYVATNTDVTFPAAGGKLLPGAGSCVAALTAATGRDPLVIGKPNAPIMEIAYRMIGLPPEHCTAVGDRVETDIAAGQRTGAQTVLVLTGVTTRAMVDRGLDPTPDRVIDRLDDIDR